MIQLLEIAINRRRIAHRSTVILRLLVKMNLSPLLRELNQRTSLLRNELKIKGQIGKAHLRDKLTYVSLIYQINEA